MNIEENAEIRNKIQSVIILIEMLIKKKEIPNQYLKVVDLDLKNLILFLNKSI